MNYSHENLLDIYSSPEVETFLLSQEGVVCISYGDPGTPGGELVSDDDDPILEF